MYSKTQEQASEKGKDNTAEHHYPAMEHSFITNKMATSLLWCHHHHHHHQQQRRQWIIPLISSLSTQQTARSMRSITIIVEYWPTASSDTLGGICMGVSHHIRITDDELLL
jgi:hypothetical protein